ncbi:hypothetical protein LINPERHAP1_LOCUS34968, partial [Linum perenne]
MLATLVVFILLVMHRLDECLDLFFCPLKHIWPFHFIDGGGFVDVVTRSMCFLVMMMMMMLLLLLLLLFLFLVVHRFDECLDLFLRPLEHIWPSHFIDGGGLVDVVARAMSFLVMA